MAMISIDSLKAAGIDDEKIEQVKKHAKTNNCLIASIFAREILDSRGNPTVEVDLVTKGG
eukprot:CAMPEP_0115132446 /NCGR_PEP_ID=MMETSP0227-20121206/53752_1 /TAXON_ID=89957 /ORGANISM="Polarella glacialis, Strain CCMP 1383" /LENGTH=59 /DNA_ID=CAMNT_0002538229 /DNA_START=71 /DNA_END=246 /DNA_ORIENTATION=+